MCTVEGYFKVSSSDQSTKIIRDRTKLDFVNLTLASIFFIETFYNVISNIVAGNSFLQE